MKKNVNNTTNVDSKVTNETKATKATRKVVRYENFLDKVLHSPKCSDMPVCVITRPIKGCLWSDTIIVYKQKEIVLGPLYSRDDLINACLKADMDEYNLNEVLYLVGLAGI